MPIIKTELVEILQNSFESAEIEINALAQDNNHYSLNIKSKAFNGKSLIAQHRMVYTVLAEAGVDLHALAIQTVEKPETI
jgi:stress-induced morphogen